VFSWAAFSGFPSFFWEAGAPPDFQLCKVEIARKRARPEIRVPPGLAARAHRRTIPGVKLMPTLLEKSCERERSGLAIAAVVEMLLIVLLFSSVTRWHRAWASHRCSAGWGTCCPRASTSSTAQVGAKLSIQTQQIEETASVPPARAW
jgi:hypothetical protein